MDYRNELNFAQLVAQELNLLEGQVQNVLDLLNEGATIPFIARYRKDKTGALDEVQIQKIQETTKALKEFYERKIFITKSITDQGKMSADLEQAINSAASINELEDIYLPYKPKRRTKAQVARENGLEPLALAIFNQSIHLPESEANQFLNEQIATVELALQGARDIISEWINESAEIRAMLRNLFQNTAVIQSKVIEDKKELALKYKDYFDFSEPIKQIPSHRLLAIMRGFMEGFIRMEILPEEETALEMIAEKVIQNKQHEPTVPILKRAIRDAYRRLLHPSLESECRTELKTQADEEAIAVFAENLRQLLLSAPLGAKRLIAIDPGYRTGCKVVCLDDTGTLLYTDLIFIHEKNNKLIEAEQKIKKLATQYDIQAFAIGDGTAGRETEQFVKNLGLGLPIFLVNEDGASIYSASEIARAEFPDHDITVRGSVSIGRRLMDPLAELVKIDPKSIGVGQYQHDVNQSRLKEKLDQTVESCVNQVGVNLNTASSHLLSYVSGIGPSIAENIVKHRSEFGQFTSRKELLKVPRLGAKAFEQCAGFLRIKHAKHPLDSSGVHPEAYHLVEQMAADLKVDLSQLIGNEKLIQSIPIQQYVSEHIGVHTVKDIIKELKKPGLDPRPENQVFEFANVFKIEDVVVGMELPGVVTNLTRFGAFVDIGVKQDGLVHISEVSNKYITDPSEVLALNQKVKVLVTEVDIVRKRIGLSIKQLLKDNKQQSKAQKNNSKMPTPQKEVNMNDALHALKSKFGK
jgi:uncharacterized protein